jgi:hypothetical protein
MSLNQIYYDPTKPFNVGSQSNIKANRFRCLSLETDNIVTENILADNLTVTEINGAPYQAGALPVLGNENDLLMVKAGNAVWSQNLVINAVPITFGEFSTFNCLSNNFNVTSANFTMNVLTASIIGVINIRSTSTINFDDDNGNVSTIIMNGTTIITNSVNQTMNNNSRLLVNNGAVILDGTTFLQTPQVRFDASIGTSLKFYGEYRQKYEVTWDSLDGTPQTLVNGIEPTIYFTRIGRMINMTIPRIKFTQGAIIQNKYLVLDPINPPAELLLYLPDPQVMSSYSSYQSIGRGNANTLGLFFIDEIFLIFNSTVTGGLFTMTDPNTEFIIGGFTSIATGDIGGISLSYYRDRDV